MEDKNRFHTTDRTEEVQDIIERMPVKFGKYVTYIVVLIVSFLLLFGYLVRYPDVVSGAIVINTNIAPIKLVAQASGRLILNKVQTQDKTDEHEVIAFIQNPTSFDTLQDIYDLIKNVNPTIGDPNLLEELPKKVELGEINSKYYSFLNSLQQFDHYNKNRHFQMQIKNLYELLQEQHKSIMSAEQKLSISDDYLKYMLKFYERDSVLYSKNVISEAEFDKVRMSLLQSKENYQNNRSAYIKGKELLKQTEGQIQSFKIQDIEKEKELKLQLIATYNELLDNIHAWEEKYVFKAPFMGRVQFLKFWSNNQFIQAGQEVFTIIPEDDRPYGQLTLPALGAGKVQIGQEVIVKLDNFPYMEYGSISGTVKDISLTTNTEKTQEGNIETYLITISFPNELRTNYGKALEFRHESRGSAEIITKDRRFIQRMFDNLKYVLNK